jgi:hypothetical protein
MGIHTAWQAIGQRPWRFLASSWPWRSLAYLCCGFMPSAAVAAGLIALFALPSSEVALAVLPPVVLALLLSGPVVTRYERWRLRLMEPDPAPDRPRPVEGTTRRALEAGYGVVSVVALWLIDLAVVGLALIIPVGLTVMLLRGSDAGWGVQAAMFAVAVLTLPVAAYPLTAWAGARSALARAILAPRQAELDERLVEVTRSRARLVDAFEVERRRIERDLHDGAQQRLVAMTVALGLARLDLPPDSTAAEQVKQAHEQAKQALTELRELIRGVHPQVLTDRGLPAAVADAAGRSPVQVDVDVVVPQRLPAGIEVAAYFAVCEALGNVAKHSRATRASVRGRLVKNVLVVECTTMAWAAPIRRPAAGSPGWPTGSPWWTVGCCCPARPAGRPWYERRSRACRPSPPDSHRRGQRPAARGDGRAAAPVRARRRRHRRRRVRARCGRREARAGHCGDRRADAARLHRRGAARSGCAARRPSVPRCPGAQPVRRADLRRRAARRRHAAGPWGRGRLPAQGQGR